MCGIFGFIGKSVNPRISFELAHALLIKTETRGEHATGFWACEKNDGIIFYDKEPVKSSIYATREIWCKDFARCDADLLLGHCRLSSTGVGHEKYNKNNHPHVSVDRRVALVHNGRIPEHSQLKGRYDMCSDCDSEILLRIFESTEDLSDKEKETNLKDLPGQLSPALALRLLGLKEIFARVNYGHMAVAIGERGDDKSRYLWLFRNEERPLHVVDMRKSLGQIFFCSTAEIWRAAVDACPSIKEHIQEDQVIIEFPPDQIWLMALDSEDNWLLKKFRVSKTKFYDWKENEDNIKFKRKATKPPAKIITRLDKEEEIVKVEKVEKVDTKTETTTTTATATGKKKVTGTASASQTGSTTSTATAGEATTTRQSGSASPNPPSHHTVEPPPRVEEVVPTVVEVDMAKFDSAVSEIQKTLKEVETIVHNMSKEESLGTKDFEMIMKSMNDAVGELKATLNFLRP